MVERGDPLEAAGRERCAIVAFGRRVPVELAVEAPVVLVAREAPKAVGRGLERAEDLAIKQLRLEDAPEALDPYIVLGRVSETDGAVAGEPNAMAALRYAADGQVGWSWARSASDRRPRGGPSHPGRVGPMHRRTRGDGSIARSASALRQWNATPSLFGNGHLMDICARSLIWVRWQSRSRLEPGVLRPCTEVVG